MSIAPDNSNTRIGVVVLTEELSPSWEYPLSPQHQAVVSEETAQLWDTPPVRFRVAGCHPAEGVTDGDTDGDDVVVGVLDGVTLTDAVSEMEAENETVGVTDDVTEMVGVRDGVMDLETDTVGDGDCVVQGNMTSLGV
jgi:hypothetical protein